MAAESAVFEKIVATFTWPPITPTPPPFSATLTAVVDALNAQNFVAARALMDQTFGFGFWGSEGTSTTADLAILDEEGIFATAHRDERWSSLRPTLRGAQADSVAQNICEKFSSAAPS